jgi:hypothetical protein
MGSSDARRVDFSQPRGRRIADSIVGLAGQIKLTTSHVERLNREVGDLCEVVLPANHIISAAARAMMRIDDIERRPDEPRP